MATGGINVKAYLEKDGDVKGEIRRFQIPAVSGDLFTALVKKVSEIFALPPQNGFRLFWQDSDGDFVTFSSTVELMEAVRNSPEGILRLYIRPVTAQDGPQPSTSQGATGEKKEEEKAYHPGVICDGCDQHIFGPRYKCVTCPDYDLCSTCEQKGVHPEHDKFKINNPKFPGGQGGFMPPHFRRWMHRFMRRCGPQNPAGGATPQGQGQGEGGCGATPRQGAATAEEDDLLKDVGENIRAFLDPFGIDVSYEVRHDNAPPQRGNWSWGFGQGGCNRGQCPRQGQKTAEKPAEKKPEDEKEPEEKPAEEPVSEDQEIPIVMEEDEVEPTAQPEPTTQPEPAAQSEPSAQPRADRRDESPVRSDEDWTMVQEGEVTGEAAAAQREGIYPNLKVAQAVEMMKAMGFTDDNGCLTRLLTGTDGDIAKALDTLKLGAEQASRLA